MSPITAFSNGPGRQGANCAANNVAVGDRSGGELVSITQ
jgi:hypothetical protein